MMIYTITTWNNYGIPVCIEDKEMHRLVPDAVLWWSDQKTQLSIHVHYVTGMNEHDEWGIIVMLNSEWERQDLSADQIT